jgi:hypothetical protein
MKLPFHFYLSDRQGAEGGIFIGERSEIPGPTFDELKPAPLSIA